MPEYVIIITERCYETKTNFASGSSSTVTQAVSLATNTDVQAYCEADNTLISQVAGRCSDLLCTCFTI